MSVNDVALLITKAGNVKHRAILMLCYSVGLRVGEVVKLKISDIDNNRGLITIRGVKGRKDRQTLLKKRAP